MCSTAGAFEVLELVEHVDEAGKIVAVDRAEIFEPEVFEDVARREGVLDALLDVIGDIGNLLRRRESARAGAGRVF